MLLLALHVRFCNVINVFTELVWLVLALARPLHATVLASKVGSVSASEHRTSAVNVESEGGPPKYDPKGDSYS